MIVGARRGNAGGVGFTLIELLVVVSIIAILVTAIVSVGVRVFTVRKGDATRSVLRTLDRALDEYIEANSGPPRYKVALYEDRPGDDNDLEPYNGEDHAPRPDASVFLLQAQGFGEVDAIVTGIPEEFLVTTDLDRDTTPSVLDAWAVEGWGDPWPVASQQLVYFVHPKNRLAQDLYGQCVNGRPYFMSAGPDLLYGLRDEFPNLSGEAAKEAAIKALEDNVYSYDGVERANQDMGGVR